MKVLQVLNNFLPHHIAGTEVYVASLARELKFKQTESVILIPNSQNLYEEYFFEHIKVIKYAESSVANREIIAGKKVPEGLQNFVNTVDSEKPDVVHFHELAGSIGIGISHVRAVKALGYKIVITLHLAKYSCRTGTLMYMNKIKCDGIIRKIKCSRCWLNNMGENGIKATLITAGFTMMDVLNIDTRFLSNSFGTVLAFPRIIEEAKSELLELQDLTEAIVVLTQWYQRILVNNGLSKSHLPIIEHGIPNPFSRTYFHQNKNQSLRLIFIGRISYFKGVDLLINSVKQLPSDKVSLDIYGSTTEEDYFKACLKLSKECVNINWKGQVAPDLVIPTIEKYDVLCIPSMVSEMGPFVLMEAFASGIPVIASNVYGNAEQIKHDENGWLFCFNDINSLTFHLKKLIQNPSLIDIAKSNIKSVRNFDLVASEHFELYNKITAKR
jgi:glycosyltransferase involved in cell wall biosynthesis